MFLLCSLPLLWLALRAFGVSGLSLGPNPVEALLHGLGLWGLRLLLLTLCVRPAAVTLRQPRLMRLRRMVGLFAFTYLVLHFLTWLVLDRGLDLNGIAADIVKRPFITVGFAALAAADPAGRHVDGSLDATAGATVAFAAQARLRRRPARLPALPVAGEGRLARAGALHRGLRGADVLALVEAPGARPTSSTTRETA